MKLNRVLGAFVLTGLFSIAAMAAQAQTRVMVRFGSPAAGVAVNYVQHAPGNGYTWVSGYYNGNEWMPGQWVYRADSRYQRRDNDRYYDNDRRDNRDGYYGDNDNRYRNNDRYGYNRNDRNRNDRYNRDNQRNDRGDRH